MVTRLFQDGIKCFWYSTKSSETSPQILFYPITNTLCSYNNDKCLDFATLKALWQSGHSGIVTVVYVNNITFLSPESAQWTHSSCSSLWPAGSASCHSGGCTEVETNKMEILLYVAARINVIRFDQTQFMSHFSFIFQNHLSFSRKMRGETGGAMKPHGDHLVYKKYFFVPRSPECWQRRHGMSRTALCCLLCSEGTQRGSQSCLLELFLPWPPRCYCWSAGWAATWGRKVRF